MVTFLQGFELCVSVLCVCEFFDESFLCIFGFSKIDFCPVDFIAELLQLPLHLSNELQPPSASPLFLHLLLDRVLHDVLRQENKAERLFEGTPDVPSPRVLVDLQYLLEEET